MAFNKTQRRLNGLSFILGIFSITCVSHLVLFNESAFADIPSAELKIAADATSSGSQDSKMQLKARCQVSHYYSSDDLSMPISGVAKNFRVPMTNLAFLSKAEPNSKSNTLLAHINPSEHQQGFRPGDITDSINPSQFCRWGCYSCSGSPPTPGDPCFIYSLCWDCR